MKNKDPHNSDQFQQENREYDPYEHIKVLASYDSEIKLSRYRRKMA